MSRVKNRKGWSLNRAHKLYTRRKAEFTAQASYKEWETPDQWFDTIDEGLHLDREKELDCYSSMYVDEYEMSQMEQWELDETPETLAEDYIDLMIMEMEAIMKTCHVCGKEFNPWDDFIEDQPLVDDLIEEFICGALLCGDCAINLHKEIKIVMAKFLEGGNNVVQE